MSLPVQFEFLALLHDAIPVLGQRYHQEWGQPKNREMADLFPEKEHWLGGVFVSSAHRGQYWDDTRKNKASSKLVRYSCAKAV